MKSLDSILSREYMKSDKLLFFCETFAKFFANDGELHNCMLLFPVDEFVNI